MRVRAQAVASHTPARTSQGSRLQSAGFTWVGWFMSKVTVMTLMSTSSFWTGPLVTPDR